jgi:S-DNA-T family DNA segregation ATPase FtsK/SpoIIIE
MIGTSSILAVSWGMANLRYRKNHERLSERKRIERYRTYLKETEARLRTANTAERLRLNNSCLNAQDCAALPGDGTLRLWERMPSHEDFLKVRLGIGDVPMPCEIQIQTKRLSIIDDPLRDEPQRLKEVYGVVQNAPVAVSLREKTVFGILGGEDAARLAQGIVVQIAAMHSYTDVKLCVLYDENTRSQWDWTRWLPHVFPQDRRMRMSVCKPAAVHEVLNYIDEILRVRSELMRVRGQENDPAQEALPLPHYVVVSTQPGLIERHPVLNRLFADGLGATLIIIAPSMESLPKECRLIANMKDEGQGLFTAEGDVNRLRFELPAPDIAPLFAKRIAPVRVSDLDDNSSIPAMAPFLHTYGVARVEQLDVWRFWNENMAFDGLKSIIGIRAGGTPFVLDISEKFHGPHGLVAGTTGSGKSVMLQTYILSLAINYHPRQVQFILIDYKGGGMSEALKGLPHVAGCIDNLQSERNIQRALTSIQGEIKRREAVFKRVGVSNLDEYIRLFHDDPDEGPIAHLIIVVDEFAELKMENKDFIHDLVSVSRVGRSVGVHLILATQKPSNSVDDEIWSNTRFRICLRVSSRGDSMDMLKRPDAAYIKGMGRCYVQVGSDELFEQVQTLYSGAAYKPDEIGEEQLPRMLDDLGVPVVMRSVRRQTGQRTLTEMGAVMGRIREVSGEHRISAASPVWMEEVPTRLRLTDIPACRAECFDGKIWPSVESGRVQACLGLADDLSNQRHLPVWVDFTLNRNHLFIGTASSGKTTALQTLVVSLALRYTPEALQIYIFSLSSRTMGSLAGLPHVGGIVYDDEVQEQLRLLNMLERENERRQSLFTLASTDNYLEYCRATRQREGLERVPAIIVAIDRIQQAKDSLDEDNLARLTTLIREGSSRGLYFVATAMSMNEVPVRIQPSFHAIALELKERGDYGEALGCRVPPEMNEILRVKGRGLMRSGDELMEMQVALYGSAELDVQRADEIRRLAGEMAAQWHGRLPAPIPRIPENARWADLLTDVGAPRMPGTLPMGYLALEGAPFAADLFQDHAWLITGPRQSGKTSLLRGAALSLRRANAQVHVIADASWRDFAAQNGLTLYLRAGEELTACLRSLQETASSRNAQRKQVPEAERAELMHGFDPIALIIDDLDQIAGWFNQSINNFLGESASAGQGFGIGLFAAVSHQGASTLRGNSLYQALAARQCGVALGGRLSDGGIFQTELPFNQRNQPLPMGYGWLIRRGETRKLFLPKA